MAAVDHYNPKSMELASRYHLLLTLRAGLVSRPEITWSVEPAQATSNVETTYTLSISGEYACASNTILNPPPAAACTHDATWELTGWSSPSITRWRSLTASYSRELGRCRCRPATRSGMFCQFNGQWYSRAYCLSVVVWLSNPNCLWRERSRNLISSQCITSKHYEWCGKRTRTSSEILKVEPSIRICSRFKQLCFWTLRLTLIACLNATFKLREPELIEYAQASELAYWAANIDEFDCTMAASAHCTFQSNPCDYRKFDNPIYQDIYLF